MNVRFTIRHIFVIVFSLCLVTAVSPCLFGQGIGFQASLLTPSEVVAPYDPPDTRFSAALYPKSSPVLGQSILRTPIFEESSFEHNSLRFGLKLNQSLSMVPISVDAEQYLLYRSTRQTRSVRDSLVQHAIRQSRQKKGSGRLSFGVPLPRRVERLVGEGGGNLTVSGSQLISFAGRSQWRDVANTDQYRQSKFPALNMDQISRFEIAGTVGSKISVRVSQDNQTDIPLANRIQIRYKGDDDDILKIVEAGNTTLSLPSARFLGSYSRSIQGLFGIKLEAVVGSLKLTAIASQEKGTSEHSNVSATTEQGAKIIRDAQYADGRVYDIFSQTDVNAMEPGDSVVRFEIYEEIDSTDYPFAQMLPDPAKLYDTTRMERFHVRKLVQNPEGSNRSAFEVFDNPLTNQHYIIFLIPKANRALAIYYEYERAMPDGAKVRIRVGNIDSTELKLKKIRASYSKFVPTDPTWDLMWRNCYDIPVGSRIEDLDIKVFRGLPGSEENGQNVSYQVSASGEQQSSYLSILGLDVRKGTFATPDLKVDDLPSIFKSEWGLLVLPNRTPFNTSATFAIQGGRTQELSVKIPELYNSRDQDRFKSSQYYFQMSSKTRSSIIRLNRYNIIAGSERLTLNGRQLVKDVDYSISYEIGQVTLLKEEALDPNAQLSVDFEYASLLALQKKSLFGMRAEYDISKNLKVGSTFLYKSDKGEERKPRVGQENSRLTVGGIDFSLTLYPSILTKLVNALPFVTSDAPSSLTISGGIAQSRPNPNVIGVAYVDDFEGTVEQLSIGLSRVNWRLCSVPEQMKKVGDSVQLRRGRMLWYLPPALPWDSVYKSERKQGEGLIQYFRMVHRPNTLGIGVKRATAPGIHWAGIQAPIRPLDQDRLRLFEVRLRGRKGIMHIDIGQISEDVNGDGLDTKSENADGNRSVTPEEDVGMDGMPNSGESGYNASTNPDPNRDDFRSYVGASSADYDNNPPPVADSLRTEAFKDSVVGLGVLRYDWINGTEGNLGDGPEPDQEARLSSSMQWQSNYFAYTIDLSDTTFLVDSSENGHGWRTYRIPIRDTSIAGFDHLGLDTEDPPALKWNEANYVRIWLESDSTDADTLIVDVANWYFVQSSWEDTVRWAYNSPEKARFYVASVSDEENNNFTPPPGVEAYFDKTNNVTEAQRAMALVFDSAFYGDTCMTVKELLTIDRYTGYRKMKMYVHGPESAAQDTIKFFFRLGTDKNNFYEYQTMLAAGWADRNNIDIDFNALTAFKDSLIRFRDTTKNILNDNTSGHYRVRGSPNLNQIKFLACGLINLDSTLGKDFISGEIWVDELRVTDVRSDVGTAAGIDVSGRMSDLITNFSAGYSAQDPYFRGLAAATKGGSEGNLGSGKSDKSYRWNLSLAMHKFLPRSWSVALPVALSYSHSEQLPLLSTNSDIVLPPDARFAERFTSETKSFSVSEVFSQKKKNPLFSMLLNRQTVSFSYSQSKTRTPVVPYDMSENYNIPWSYDMGYPGLKPLPIFFWTKPIPIFKRLSTSKLSYYPNAWRWSGTLNRALKISEDNKKTRTSSLSRSFDANMNLEYKMFQNITFNYTYNTRRDLSDTGTVRLSFKNLRLGQELSYAQSFRTGWNPQLFGFLGTNFGYSSSYTDNLDRQSMSWRGNMTNTWSLNGQFQHQVFLGAASKLGGSGSASKPQAAGGKLVRKPFYDYPRKMLRKLTSWINPVSYKYQQTFSNGPIPGMMERPRFLYRLGFSRSVDVPVTSQSSSQPLSSEGEQYELSSGFVFLGGLVLDVKLRRDINRDLVKVGDRIERVSSGWPDLGIRIQPFKKLPFVKKFVNKFINVFTPRTSYSRQIREETNLTQGFLTSKTVTEARSPFLAVNFKLFKALSMTGTYSTTSTETERYSSTNGRRISISRSNQKTVIVTSQYSFSAPGGIGLPLLGKIKFKSQAQIGLDIRFNSTYSEAGSEGQPIAKGRDATDFSVTPTINYQFSSQIKGGLTGRWQDSRDATNTKSHSRELRIYAEIRF